MLLQTVRPNIVQSIRAYRVEDLMQAAHDAGQHFLYANMANAQSKQEVLDGIAEAFTFPAHFGKNLDALYDCMTDLVQKAGAQPGFGGQRGQGHGGVVAGGNPSLAGRHRRCSQGKSKPQLSNGFADRHCQR